MIIVGEGGIFTCYGILFKAGRDGEVSVYLFALYSFAGGSFVDKMTGYFKSRNGRQISHYGS